MASWIDVTQGTELLVVDGSGERKPGTVNVLSFEGAEYFFFDRWDSVAGKPQKIVAILAEREQSPWLNDDRLTVQAVRHEDGDVQGFGSLPQSIALYPRRNVNG